MCESIIMALVLKSVFLISSCYVMTIQFWTCFENQHYFANDVPRKCTQWTSQDGNLVKLRQFLIFSLISDNFRNGAKFILESWVLQPVVYRGPQQFWTLKTFNPSEFAFHENFERMFKIQNGPKNFSFKVFQVPCTKWSKWFVWLCFQ